MNTRLAIVGHLVWALGVLASGCQVAVVTDATTEESDTDDYSRTDGGTFMPPAKVLFIGNSFTFAFGGMGRHVERLRESAGDPGSFEADSVVQGGASLQVMWEETDARAQIDQGNYDVVVLQEDIPETTVESFYTYARLFDEAIRASGAKPVFFMAWAYGRLGWISMDEIAEAHWAMARELDIEVAPIGLAWARSSAQRPNLSMYDEDEEHPSIHGTYLGACVIYGTIFRESPVNLSYRPQQGGGLTDEEAGFLQAVSWEELQSSASAP